MALYRITNELQAIARDPLVCCSAGPIDGDDMFHWEGTVLSPEDPPYAGGVFLVDIVLSPNHPYKQPEMSFTTKIVHPNIYSNGSIDLDILRGYWTPVCTITSTLLSIYSVLSDPFPDDRLQSAD